MILPFLKATIDTNVLYSLMIRDLLLHAADRKIYQPLWSEKILAELRSATRTLASTEQNEIFNKLKSYEASAVIEPLPIEKLSLPDSQDEHVVAVARSTGASFIVTFNLKDFPQQLLSPLQILSPDDFCLMLLKQSSAPMKEAIKAHWSSIQNPKISWEEYTARLNRARLHKLSRYLNKLGVGTSL